MAETMNLPLFRKEIRGRPIRIQTNSYEIHPDDEVEDLYQLLSIAKERYPEVEDRLRNSVSHSDSFNVTTFFWICIIYFITINRNYYNNITNQQ